MADYKPKSSTKHNSDKANGGNGYYLKAGEVWDTIVDPTKALVMNIDLIVDGTTFSLLKGKDDSDTEVDLLAAHPIGMNLAGVAAPSIITNFTWFAGITRITADQDIWINLNNGM